MTRIQTLARIAASIGRRAGWIVQIDDSAGGSSYVRLGSRYGATGFETLLTIRIADHAKPGRSRGGWLKMNGPYYDLRPKTRTADRQRIDAAIARLTT